MRIQNLKVEEVETKDVEGALKLWFQNVQDNKFLLMDRQ